MGDEGAELAIIRARATAITAEDSSAGAYVCQVDAVLQWSIFVASSHRREHRREVLEALEGVRSRHYFRVWVGVFAL